MAGKMFDIAFNILGKVGGSFNSAFATASERMSKLNSKVNETKVKMKDLDRLQKSGAISTAEHAAAYGKLTAQLALAEAAQKRFSRTLAMKKTADRVQNGAGKMVLGGVVAGAALATGPAMTSVNFETSMAQVAKQVDGARTETGELSDIGKQAQEDIMQLSRSLMKSPIEIANAYALGARAGVKGTENLQKITKLGTMMGTAFELPSEQVTTDMAKIGNALGYNLETADGIAKLEALADKINYVDDQTLATGTDLIDFMNRTAGAIKALAPTMTEGMTLGLGGGLLAAGERAEVAGTAINALLTKIAAAPTQSKPFQEALDKIGLSAKELQAGTIDNADEAILDLFTRINELDQATRNDVLAELIGQEHIDTISKLTGNYDKFLDAIKKANEEAAQGSVRKEFEIMSQTTARKMEGTKASMERMFITLGDNLLPVMEIVGEGLSGVFEKVQEFAKEYPGLTNALVVGGAAFIAFGVVIGGLAWIIAGMISSFATISTALTGLSIATKVAAAGQWLLNTAFLGCPVVWIIGGIVALIAAGYLLYENWDTVKAFMTTLWDSPAFALATFLAGPIGWMIAAGVGLIANWEEVKQWFTLLWDDPGAAIDVFCNMIRDKFSAVFEWLSNKWQDFKNLFSGGGVNYADEGNPAPSLSFGHTALASGGIFERGSFLTTFAEEGAEAAIPLDGSPRALSLWAQAGEMLGIRPGGGGGTIVATFSPAITIYGTPEPGQVESEVEKANRSFLDFLHDERRLSFADG